MVAAWGLGTGLALTVAASRLVRAELFGVKPTDPSTLIAGTFALAALALAAGYLPARRASRVDPMVALRRD